MRIEDVLNGFDGAAFRRRLLGWYRREARDLPWRRTAEPYRVWLSEIILQQTRVDQGLPYYERFCAAFPTVGDLAAAPEQRVLKLWEGLGYYTRARNLHRTAKIVVADHGGRFPGTAEELRHLPGIGRYTAGAIASIAFGERAPLVDGNVARVLARLFALRDSIDDAKTKALLWDLAERLVPRIRPGDFNQAMMELGARVCTPANAGCATCPVRACCRARAAGLAAGIPARAKRLPVPQHEEAMAVLVYRGRYLLRKRPETGLLAGLWEFPSARVDGGRSHKTVLRAMAAAELGIPIDVGDCMGVVRHAFSHFRLIVHAYRCTMKAGAVLRSTATLRWVRVNELGQYPLPKTHHKLLALLGEK